MGLRCLGLVLLGFLPCAGRTASQGIPAPPAPFFRLVLRPGKAKALHGAARWRPMKGSPPVEISRAGGKPVFRMDCPFGKTPMERASWDHPFPLDLSWERGLGLLLYVEDLRPVSHFTLFLKSGKGWYAFHLRISEERKWSVLELPKEAARIEGVPSGFGKVEAVRFSVWRKGKRATRVYFGGLGLLGGKGPIGVVRWEGTRPLSSGSRRFIGDFCMGTMRLFSRLGLDAVLTSDRDLQAGIPSRIRLLVLPRNVVLPKRSLESIGSFLGRGGKILSFMVLPPPLMERAGFKRGKKSGAGRVSGVIRPDPALLPGAPSRVPFRGGRAGFLVPGKKEARVAAVWAASSGRSMPAVLLSPGFVHLDVLPDLSPGKRDPLLETFYLALLENALPGASKKAAVKALERMGA